MDNKKLDSSNHSSKNNLLKKLNLMLKKNLNISEEDATNVSKAISDEMDIPPKIAIIGKSGVGKTSTINSLFNVEWHTSETITGTLDVQKETFKLKGEGKLTVFDMPGLGDSIENDKKFIELYKRVLPDVDVILYIIQADDRGLGEDEHIIKDILKCDKKLNKKFVIGINKVDLLGENEGLEWDDYINLPSIEQEKLIERKCNEIIKRLSKEINLKKEVIVYFSAIKRYHLYDLLNMIVKYSGKAGWKISINPKDWKELAAPEIKQKTIKESKGEESI